ncbi:Uncharacterized protein Fot_29034 [Forsythia ovata]|uniref:Uncharacterized protein n=1 Tax=Forsythia ovata TaxID=205694 RepID=A0ABD1TR53_9LAMI
METTEEHNRCVLESRKKEQRNKRRRERNAEARQKQQIQFQHHGGSSHVAATEKRLLRNRQRREVNAKKKEVREQQYARLEGGVTLQNKRSRRLLLVGSIGKGNDIVDQRIQLPGEHCTSTGYDTIVDEYTVENEFSAACEGVLHARGSAVEFWLWWLRKNISRTAQRSPVKYQNMVLVDPHV